MQFGGHQIVYVSCGGTFELFCVPMSASRLSVDSSRDERLGICKACSRNDDRLRTAFGFQGPKLQDTLTREDREEVDDILRNFSRSNVDTLQLDGIHLGRVALYQLLLRTKKFDLNFNEDEWREYFVELRNTLYAFKVAGRLIDAEKPDRIFVYNGLYSVNRAACLLAEARGIPAYFMHAGANLSARLQTMMVGRGDTFSYMPRLIEAWPRFRDAPVSSPELSQVTNHFLELLRGRSIFVYSKNKSQKSFDARSHFGIRPGQKLLVATMSSNDEEMAGIMVGAQLRREGILFPTQVDWILAVAEFIATRPDLFLIIRVHPREFPNRRDGRKSQHAALLEAALSRLPDNAVVNWPADNISLYDLVDQTDVFLNAWSSTGKDMPMLGIPVVTYSSKIQWYPAELNYVGETRESFFAAIDLALEQGWSFEAARRAYRWCVFEFATSTISIGESYLATETPERTFLQKVVGRIRRTVKHDYQMDRDVRRRRPLPEVAAQINRLLESGDTMIVDGMAAVRTASLEQETAALRVELRRLADALFPDHGSRLGSRLYQALSGQN
jgi:hypothetical protein